MAKILYASYPEDDVLLITLERQFGHCVTLVSVLEAVEEELGKNHYDLLIIEPFLPVRGSLDGTADYIRKCLAVFDRIITRRDHPPVIVASTFRFCKPDYFLEEGASGVIQTPLCIEDLGELVQKVLATPS